MIRTSVNADDSHSSSHNEGFTINEIRHQLLQGLSTQDIIIGSLSPKTLFEAHKSAHKLSNCSTCDYEFDGHVDNIFNIMQSDDVESLESPSNMRDLQHVRSLKEIWTEKYFRHRERRMTECLTEDLSTCTPADSFLKSPSEVEYQRRFGQIFCGKGELYSG
jgi:hypothetical protein